jgi:hypothetical protein
VKKERKKKQEASSAVSHHAWKLVYAGVAKKQQNVVRSMYFY